MISLIPKVTILWLHIKVLTGSFQSILMMKAAAHRGEQRGEEEESEGHEPVPRSDHLAHMTSLLACSDRQTGRLDFLALFQQLSFPFRSLSQRPDTLKINDIIGRPDWLPVSLSARVCVSRFCVIASASTRHKIPVITHSGPAGFPYTTRILGSERGIKSCQYQLCASLLGISLQSLGKRKQ